MTFEMGIIKPPDELDRISFWVIMAVTLCVFIAYRLIRRSYRKRSPILCRPFKIGFQPEEDAEESNTWQQQVGPVVFYCQKQLPRSKCGWFRPPRAVNYIRGFLKNQYGIQPGGAPNVAVPEELENQLVCVSIPAKNFRCGTQCTEFVARDGQQGFWSYQMVCGGVQMTLMHVEEDTFVAGVCIYAQNRWNIFSDRLQWAFSPERLVYHPQSLVEKSIERRWCRLRHQWIIVTRNQFGEIDKFEFNGQRNSLDPIECFDCCSTSSNPSDAPTGSSNPMPDCLNWLKVEFCPLEQKPVMIGRNSLGVICHFNWNPVIAKFQLKLCEKCQVAGRNRFETGQGADDKPPSYEYLELIEMVEQQ